MPQFGQIRPELGRIDFSPISRGGQAFGQGVGQGLASLGAGLGKMKERQADDKSAIAAAKPWMEAIQGMEGVPDRISATMEEMKVRMGDPDTPQRERAAIARQVTGMAQQVFGTGMQTELQKEQVRALALRNRMDEQFGARERSAKLEAQERANEIAAFQMDKLDEEWQMKVDTHSAKLGLNDLQKQKLGWEIHQLSAMDSTDGDIWEMPFEKMPADMKAAYIFHKDLGMDKTDAINSAYGLEGPSAGEQIREMEAINFGGHPMMDLWRLTSMDGFKEKAEDGIVELSAGRGANKVKIALSDAEYATFKRLKQKYSDKVASVMKTDVDLLKDKYEDGSTATFDGVSGTIQHTPDGIYLVTSEGRYPITE